MQTLVALFNGSYCSQDGKWSCIPTAVFSCITDFQLDSLFIGHTANTVAFVLNNVLPFHTPVT